MGFARFAPCCFSERRSSTRSARCTCQPDDVDDCGRFWRLGALLRVQIVVQRKRFLGVFVVLIQKRRISFDVNLVFGRDEL